VIYGPLKFNSLSFLIDLLDSDLFLNHCSQRKYDFCIKLHNLREQPPLAQKIHLNSQLAWPLSESVIN